MDAEDFFKRFRYIPKLNLFYDEDADVYYNENGYMIDVNRPNKRMTDYNSMWEESPDIELPSEIIMEDKKAKSKFAVENLNLSPANVVQIMAIVVAIVSQYYIMENKISTIEYKMETMKTLIDDKNDSIVSLNQDIKQLNAQLAIQNSVIDNMHYRLAALSNTPSSKK